MPENPILGSKREFLEKVLQKSHTSSFASGDEMFDISMLQPKLP